MALISWVNYLEALVGRGNPTLSDVLNRPARAILTTSGLDPDADFVGFSQIGHTHLTAAITDLATATTGITKVGILAAPHMTGAVVDSGGFTVTLGGAAITGASSVTGALSVSGALSAAAGISVTGASTITGALSGITTLTATTFVGNLTGAVTGNASSATTATTANALTTPRAINGVLFDGSAAITVPAAANTLSGTGLPVAVVGSSLTSVGTLVSLAVAGALTAGSLAGPLTGNVTGNVTGNASTATALATPRTINGVAFDGSAPITVAAAAGTLTGTALPVAVVASSLTSVGVLAAPHMTFPVIDSGGLTVTAGTVTAPTFIGALTGNVTGNASGTASALATARAINGVPFDGTAAITVPAAAPTLTGASLAPNVLSSSLTSVGTLASLAVTGAVSAGSLSGTLPWSNISAAPTTLAGYGIGDTYTKLLGDARYGNLVASTSARDAAYPTPSTDQRVFNKGTGNVERYTGTVWVTDLTGSGGVVREINVMSYGGKGDGTNGDSAAIAAAVTALGSLGTGGGTIIFPKPAASYIIDVAVNLSGSSNITFAGQSGLDFLTGNTVVLKAKGTLTGAMFNCNTAPPSSRGGGYTFRGLTFQGNNQNVDAFYIHASAVGAQQVRMIEFAECFFDGLRTGLWLGDYTNELQFTYLLGVNVRRCIFNNCVKPIIADGGGFDGLHLEQVWFSDSANRMVRPISLLTSGCNLVCDNVWFSFGNLVTECIYSALPNGVTIRDSAMEGNDVTCQGKGLVMLTSAGTQATGVIWDNTRFNSAYASAVALDVNTPGGMEIRSSRFQGNINVGSTCKVFTQNVTFLGASGYTGTVTNVFVDGEARGTWTPALTFATPGNLAVSYTAQLGRWLKVGKKVTAHFEISTSAFTYTTASGSLLLTNLPFVPEAAYSYAASIGIFSGFTDATRPHLGAVVSPGISQLLFYLSGSGLAQSNVVAGAQVPTAGTVLIYGDITYEATT